MHFIAHIPHIRRSGSMLAMGAWDGGSTREWRKIRRMILANNLLMNRGRCTLRIPGVCTGKATVVHHTRGRKITGDDPRYLVAACAACNGHIGDPSVHDPRPTRVTKW